MECRYYRLADLTSLVAIVVDNWLYLHGGEIHYEENGNMTLQPSTLLLPSPFVNSPLNSYRLQNVRNRPYQILDHLHSQCNNFWSRRSIQAVPTARGLLRRIT